MVGNNELAQLIKVIENMQAKMEETDKKVESIVVAFLNLKSFGPHTINTSFESFTPLRKVGMLVEEELSKEVPAKTGNNRRNNHQNKDEKAISSKKVHAVNCITEYTPIGTTYTQALEQVLAKGRINLPKIIPLTESFRQSKCFDPSKFFKYRRSRGHNTEDY
ncbi:hypothetical protein Cgig2_007183 [Carnegiea gigantea]|uniref:Uncharacterized protein n=1 Tax=Carnegiea gigantea TaxID=171969 RepID=A0A9Q1KDF3_9CARY|nr:hypothetical protein Cgig2_007183 [Carnegiea gigantea]